MRDFFIVKTRLSIGYACFNIASGECNYKLFFKKQALY